jgi:soluble lytic murein transglycosylase-like protein
MSQRRADLPGDVFLITSKLKGIFMNREDRYDSLITYYGEFYNCDFALLKSQIKAESNFVPDAVSFAGAVGLAQFMEATFGEWYRKIYKVDLQGNRCWIVKAVNPEISIRLQAAYMSWLLIRYGGVVSRALAAYNWGIGNVDKIKNFNDSEFKNRLPEETRNYIERILS